MRSSFICTTSLILEHKFVKIAHGSKATKHPIPLEFSSQDKANEELILQSGVRDLSEHKLPRHGINKPFDVAESEPWSSNPTPPLVAQGHLSKHIC